MRQILTLFFLLSILLLGCENEYDDPKKDPTIKTLEAEVNAAGSVMLKGELTSPSNIREHGFLVSEDSDSWINPINNIRLGKPKKSGPYQYELGRTSQANRTYYYKAYVETDKQIIYGSVVSFVSRGLKDPVITRVSPEKGHLEDWINIYGRNFGDDPSKTLVRFGEVATFYWLVVSDTFVKAQIPANVKSADFNVNVINISYGTDKIATYPYSLYKPEIHEVDPKIVKIGEPFKIIGNHFDSIPQRNTVFVGNMKLEILGARRKELTVSLPKELKTSDHPIRIEAQLQEALSTFNLSLAEPIITEIPDCAVTWDEILIKGENFNPDVFWNHVSIEGQEAQIIGGNEKEILVRVPRGPFPNGNARITVKVADKLNTFSKPMCINDDWLMVSNKLPFHFYGNAGAFSLNQKGYVISKSADFNDPKDYLWEYNPSNGSWIKSSPPFEKAYTGNVTISNGKAFLYTGQDADNFWEFEPSTKTWTKKANFPGEKRAAPSMFAFSGRVFLGLGSYSEGLNNIDYLDLYEYNTSTNSWLKLTNPPAGLTGSNKASAVTLDGFVYIFGGAKDTGMNKLFRYDPSNNSWTNLAALPQAINMQTGFAFKGKIYCATGTPIGGGATPDVWIYDPSNNTWQAGPIVGKIGRYRAFSFVINDEVFLGGGDGNGFNESFIEEFFKLKN
ncbi:IPT/TIG domain-containing protein [Cecembia rubra]|uniref:IPT/TIG domain-containing protein n=1 Tax=Cecembia rubra TaxID=1485585 RepID=UPI0027144AF8|nr:IPT/TIG domain-containing protein [Cecembia rubra]